MSQRWVLCLLVCGLVSLPGTLRAGEERVKLDAEIRSLFQQTRRSPSSAYLWLQLGHAFARKRWLTGERALERRALLAYEKALALDGDNAWLLETLADSEIAWRQDLQKGVACLKRLNKVAADPVGQHRVLEHLYSRLGRLDEALRHRRAAFAFSGASYDASRIARLLAITGQPAAARSQAYQTLYLDDENGYGTPETWSTLVWLAIRQDEIAYARYLLDSAPVVHRESVPFLQAHGFLCLIESRPVAALKALRRLQSLRPAESQYRRMSKALADMGEAALAEKAVDAHLALYRTSYETAPHDLRARNFYAYACAAENRELSAVDDLSRVLGTRPEPYYRDTRAWVLYRLKRYDEAWKLIESVVEAMPQEAQYRYHAGMIAAALARGDDAAAHLEAALRLHPYFDLKELVVLRKTLAGLKTTQ